MNLTSRSFLTRAQAGFPVLAAVVVAVSVVWGWRVQADPNVKLGAAPLVGEWRFRFGPSLLLAVVIAAVVVLWGPSLATRLRFAAVMAAAAAVAVAFALSLAASDGFGHVLDPVVHKTEYWANLATLPDASAMLHHYGTVDFLLRYSVHAKGHPPAFLLLLKALAAVGLGHPWVAGALSYLGVAVVVVAVLATVRLAVDEPTARRVAPFLIVAPYAVWMGTSADAFYSAVAAVGVFLLVRSVRSGGADPATRPGLVVAVAGGLVVGLVLFFTYGGAIFGLAPLTLLVGLTWRKWSTTVRVSAAGAIGVAVVIAAFRLAGFWWFDGVQVTKSLYWAGTAQFRPAGYFAVGNLGAALIALGPAVVFGLSRLRDRRVWLVVAAGALCILAADASQYSKAEVERIWLIFYPWLVPAAVCLVRQRRWIAVQAAVAIGLQMVLVSKW
jgi:methylthioxylose transferase